MQYTAPINYALFGVLVHAGWSTHSGHYYAFVKTATGIWHAMDDSRVRGGGMLQCQNVFNVSNPQNFPTLMC